MNQETTEHRSRLLLKRSDMAALYRKHFFVGISQLGKTKLLLNSFMSVNNYRMFYEPPAELAIDKNTPAGIDRLIRHIISNDSIKELLYKVKDYKAPENTSENNRPIRQIMITVAFQLSTDPNKKRSSIAILSPDLSIIRMFCLHFDHLDRTENISDLNRLVSQISNHFTDYVENLKEGRRVRMGTTAVSDLPGYY